MKTLVCLCLLLTANGCRPRPNADVASATMIDNKSRDLGRFVARGPDFTAFREKLGKTYCDMALLAEARSGARSDQLPFRKLRSEELAAILSYIGPEFRPINRALRGGDPAAVSEQRAMILVLASALNRLPTFSGTAFRGANLPPAIVENYRQALATGEPVTELGFTSTSLNFSIPEKFGEVLFVVHGKHHGHLLEGFTSLVEREVLFTAGTDFKVTSIKKLNAGQVAKLRPTPEPPLREALDPLLAARKVEACPVGTKLTDDEGAVDRDPADSAERFNGPIGFDDTGDGGLAGLDLAESSRLVIEMEDLP